LHGKDSFIWITWTWHVRCNSIHLFFLMGGREREREISQLWCTTPPWLMKMLPNHATIKGMHSKSEMIFFTLSIYFKFQKICIPVNITENWALISCVNTTHIPTYIVKCNINENVTMFKFIEVTQTNKLHWATNF